MYLPWPFVESSPAELHQIIRLYPLGMLVTHNANGMEANHLPFVIDEGRGPNGALLAHVARANTMWQAVGADEPVMVVFRGAQGYISPSWYPTWRTNSASSSASRSN
jgi:transcriptional regulator